MHSGCAAPDIVRVLDQSRCRYSSYTMVWYGLNFSSTRLEYIAWGAQTTSQQKQCLLSSKWKPKLGIGTVAYMHCIDRVPERSSHPVHLTSRYKSYILTSTCLITCSALGSRRIASLEHLRSSRDVGLQCPLCKLLATPCLLPAQA